MPSRNSRLAPPPVLMNVTLSPSPHRGRGEQQSEKTLMRTGLTAVLGLVLVVCPPEVRAQQGRDPQHPRWFASYEMAKAEARASGRPMFLVFRCVP